MFNKTTKVLCACLCAALLASSFGACSSGSSGSSSAAASSAAASSEASSEAASSEAASSAAAADPVGKYDQTLTLKTVRSLDTNVKFNANVPEEKTLTDNVWATAYKDRLNIVFDYMWTPNSDQYDSKWNTAIASNDIPDCAFIGGTIYKELLEAGMVEDMTEAYNTYVGKTYKEYCDVSGIDLKFMTQEGKLLGLPYPGAAPEDCALIGIRKDWLKKVNMTEPKTYDDLIKVAKAFMAAKLGGSDTYGICVSKGSGTSLNAGQNDLIGPFNMFGAYYDIWMDDGSGKLVYSTIQDKMKTALTELQKLYKDGIFRQDFSVKDSPTAGEDVASGKVGITFGTYWFPLGTMGDCMENDKTAEWEILEPPTADGSKYITQTSSSPWGYIFVKKGIEHPEAIVKVMNLNYQLVDEDYDKYALNSDGIERFKYSFGGAMPSKPFKNLDDYLAVAAAMKSGDTSSMNTEMKNIYAYSKAVADGTGDALAHEYDLVFGPSSTYGFINEMKNDNRMLINADLTLPTETQTSSNENLRTTLNTAILKVIMGDNISTFDSAVSAWKSGGGDKMTQELNDWYSKNK